MNIGSISEEEAVDRLRNITICVATWNKNFDAKTLELCIRLGEPRFFVTVNSFDRTTVYPCTDLKSAIKVYNSCLCEPALEEDKKPKEKPKPENNKPKSRSHSRLGLGMR